jgi:phosphoribosylanthranilate isomerase
MRLLERFLDPSSVSLKICGVTTRADAEKLVEMGVDALGVNFWMHSKRHLPPADAAWLAALKGKILRVGVFVNADPEDALRLIHDGLIDVIQAHGDESPEDLQPIRRAGVPFFKGIGVKTRESLRHAAEFGASAILLDAHAPGVYGGTGETFDWDEAVDFIGIHPRLPVILAGGIVAANAAAAAARVRPAALDIASGAETRPGVKDFEKVSALIAAIHTQSRTTSDRA